jgi:hypothetical protein
MTAPVAHLSRVFWEKPCVNGPLLAVVICVHPSYRTIQRGCVIQLGIAWIARVEYIDAAISNGYFVTVVCVHGGLSHLSISFRAGLSPRDNGIKACVGTPCKLYLGNYPIKLRAYVDTGKRWRIYWPML